MNKNSTLVGDRLNDLYKKYFQGTDYQMGQSFDSVKANMTDEDIETSNKLLQYYTQQQGAQQDFNYSNNLIEKNRQQSLQENSIAKEKAMMYMPQYLKSQGLGGLGVSESAIIRAQNNYNNARNTINTEAQNRSDELARLYQSNIDNLDSGYLSEAESIASKYENGISKEKSANLYNKASIELSREINNALVGGKLSQAARKNLYDLIEQNYRGKLTDSDVSNLQALIEAQTITTAEEEQAEADKSYLVNNYGVEVADDGSIAGAVANSLAGVTSFGDFAGTGNNRNQDEWVKNVLAATQGNNPLIKNGDVVDFNRGGGTDNYVYYNGYWYPTKNKRTIDRGKNNSVERK